MRSRCFFFPEPPFRRSEKRRPSRRHWGLQSREEERKGNGSVLGDKKKFATSKPKKERLPARLPTMCLSEIARRPLERHRQERFTGIMREGTSISWEREAEEVTARFTGENLSGGNRRKKKGVDGRTGRLGRDRAIER